MKVLFTWKLHSVVDIITNSSSELFVTGSNIEDLSLKDFIENFKDRFFEAVTTTRYSTKKD